MTNGTSQGLFVVVAIVIFGIFTLTSYLLFKDNLKPTLANIFTDGLEQADSYLSGVIKEKYLTWRVFDNEINVTGLSEIAYKNGVVRPQFKTIILPETVNGEDLKVLNFNNFNNNGHKGFIGVEKIVGNSSLQGVASLATGEESIKELDLSKTKVESVFQYFTKDSHLKKVTFGKHMKKLSYGMFQGKYLEEITFTNTTEFEDINSRAFYGMNTNITLNAPKELEGQLKPYENKLKVVHYY
ncbi:TPA: leucine-rich repeat protein [Enterococcus faecalis]|nr:leucine-rich repeat protein [Enterococcus faecalis]